MSNIAHQNSICIAYSKVNYLKCDLCFTIRIAFSIYKNHLKFIVCKSVSWSCHDFFRWEEYIKTCTSIFIPPEKNQTKEFQAVLSLSVRKNKRYFSRIKKISSSKTCLLVKMHANACYKNALKYEIPPIIIPNHL